MLIDTGHNDIGYKVRGRNLDHHKGIHYMLSYMNMCVLPFSIYKEIVVSYLVLVYTFGHTLGIAEVCL